MRLALTDEESEGVSLPPDAVKDREQEPAVMVQYVYRSLTMNLKPFPGL